MASVSLRNVVKSYGKADVIHDVSLDVCDGEFMVLVGPSGCGKSTLLRILAGLEWFSSGSVSIDGREVNRVPAKDRDIAMVFQSYALYPHMTVAQNMGFGLRLRKRPKSLIAEQVQRAARILDLEKVLERYPRELSGGQRQRVAMGRAIVRDPKVYLFDEPLSNLDAKLRVAMRAEIKALQQALHTTTVYVTHDQVEAMTMADRIAVLRDGCIEQVGTPLDIYDHPANLFVAQFIGSHSMNIIEGDYDPVASVVRMRGTDGDLYWPAPRIGVPAATSVALGVRPDMVLLTDPNAKQSIRAHVRLVQCTGSETEILLGTGSCEITVVVRERLDVRVGEVVGVHVPTDKAHMFDRISGCRLPLEPNG